MRSVFTRANNPPTSTGWFGDIEIEHRTFNGIPHYYVPGSGRTHWSYNDR